MENKIDDIEMNDNNKETLKEELKAELKQVEKENDETSENDLNENSEELGGIKRGEAVNYNKLYESLEKYCNLKRRTHWMCARYYNQLDRVFLIPSIKAFPYPVLLLL